MNMANDNPFLRFHALGYTRLVPIVPPTAEISEKSSLSRNIGKHNDPRGKAVGIKGNHGKWYGYDWLPYENDEQDLTRWHKMGAGVGIKTGNGLVLIDADTKNVESAKIIRDTLSLLIPLNSIRVGQYPKAGYVVRTDPDFRYTRIEFGERDDRGNLTDRVEILAEGRQFVAHGIHPRTSKPYEWPKGIPGYEDLPFISGSLLLAFLEDLRNKLPASSPVIKEGAQANDVDQKTLQGDLGTIRKAVRSIPNTSAHFASRESYRDFGYAIKAALPDNAQEAFDLFAEWCARWEDGTNDHDVVEADWRRMKPPFKRGASYLYELAEKHSGGQFSSAEVWFDQLPDEEENPFAQVELNSSKDQKGKFKFLDFADITADALSTNKPLIKGLIDHGTMSVLYGDSNVGKTFVAMDIGFHIATGQAYADMKTTQGLVVYVAAEGGNGAKRRVAALKDKYPEFADKARFKLLPAAVDLRRPDIDLNPFIADLQAIGEPISLLVVDTLSRALAGGDENSSVDMGAIVKHFDMVRAATSAHLMVVHHTGKDKAKGARGHTLLRAATDTELEVAEGVLSVTKQRDLDKAWTIGFALEVRKLGIDEDGDPITSCTVKLVTATEARARSNVPTAMEQDVLDALEAIAATSEGEAKAVSTSELEKHFADNMSGMTKENVRYHLRNLFIKKLVEKPKRGFWAKKAEETASSVSDAERFFKCNTEETEGEAEGNIFE